MLMLGWLLFMYRLLFESRYGGAILDGIGIGRGDGERQTQKNNKFITLALACAYN